MASAPETRVNYDPARREHKPVSCGFCLTGNHEKCPRVVGGRGFKVTKCPCEDGTHTGILRCVLCKRPGAAEHIDQESYTCVNSEDCAIRQREAFSRYPVIRQLSAVRQESNKEGNPMSDIDGNLVEGPASRTTRQKAEPKPPKSCRCGCDGQTKGGNFLPGHDARWVSALVKSTDLDDPQSIAEGQELAASVSAALGTKFEKAAMLARSKKDKTAATGE